MATDLDLDQDQQPDTRREMAVIAACYLALAVAAAMLAVAAGNWWLLGPFVVGVLLARLAWQDRRLSGR